MQNRDTVILESVLGAFDVTVSTPGQPYKYVFKKDESGKFTCEIPLVLQYKNARKELVNQFDNLPQFLLNNYKHLRLLKHKKAPVVVQPEVYDPNVTKEEEVSSKKGK